MENMKNDDKKVEMPANIRIQQARNYIRMAFNKAASDYNLDGIALSLILESILAEEYKQQLAYNAEMTDALITDICKRTGNDSK